MKIDKIISQNRRDFQAIYICEHCGYKYECEGYDDTYFHHTVIPDMMCPQCGKKANPNEHRELKPKYDDNFQI